MGRIKQLLPLKNEPAIRFCLHRILSAGLDEVVVVLGNHRQKIEPFLADLSVTIVVNEKSDSEMADSVRAGRKALTESVTGVMIHPVDQPLVRSQTYRLIADRHARDPRKIIVPVCEGRGGHPTLFPAALLRQSKPAEPLNHFIQKHGERLQRLVVDDPGTVLDMDHQHEYEKLAALALQES